MPRLSLGVRSLRVQVQHRRRGAPRGGQQSRKMRGETSTRAVVHRYQQPLDARQECARLELLALEARPLLLAQRQPAEGPAQHRGHRHGRHHRHGDDCSEPVHIECPELQPDRGNDHFGRAAGIHPTADCERLGRGQSAEATADEGAEKLADTRERDEPEGEPQKLWLGERGDIDGEADEREEHRHEQADDEPAQLGAELPGEHWRLTKQQAGDERTEHEMDPERVGEQCQQTHDHEDRGDVGHLAGESVVRPAQGSEHQPATEGETQGEKQRDTQHALGDAGEVEGTTQGQTEDDRQDDPADGVIEDRCGDDDLPDRAAQESELAYHQRHDLYRGNR